MLTHHIHAHLFPALSSHGMNRVTLRLIPGIGKDGGDAFVAHISPYMYVTGQYIRLFPNPVFVAAVGAVV
jgi:hypothetical protein